MKKIVSVLLTLSMAAGLSACGLIRSAPPPSVSPSSVPSPAAEPTLDQLLDAMLRAAGEAGLAGGPDGESLAQELELLYGISPDMWTEAAIRRAGGARASEITILHLTAGTDTNTVREGLENYLLSRQGDFTGYEPAQAALAADGRLLFQGRWAALVIAEEADTVSLAFADCFGGSAAVIRPEPPAAPPPQPAQIPAGRVPYVDPEIDDMTVYDTSSILAAWQSGDRSALSAYDLAVLEAAEAVLSECLAAGMTDYEKERAVYDWVVKNVRYDWDHYDPSVETARESYTPYGPLLNGKAVCLGFASVFQLLMDMAGVECITVVGAAFSSREDHAWNMVRLKGRWYCADTTWDEGALFPILWEYFNVTSDHMAKTDHQWDYSAVPEATASGGGKY